MREELAGRDRNAAPGPLAPFLAFEASHFWVICASCAVRTRRRAPTLAPVKLLDAFRCSAAEPNEER
jgi:hypothetical protein